MNKKLDTKVLDKTNYLIAEDLRLIAEKYKEKDPALALDAIKTSELYLAKIKEEK